MFAIVRTNQNIIPVLGLPTIKEFQLLKRVETIQADVSTNYKDLFQDIGNIKIEPYDFKLREKYQTVVSSPRKIPFQLMDKLKVELEKLEEQEIIIKVTDPSEFVNPIIFVTKPNKNIRICLDPQKLNAALLRE
ncbi:hypothetical protein QE152_g36737 [Popillia japonica]|uniref:Uncharacterized protein n=1 Tax=Popillia japonica TaxID=7064 RepID=A0AAW1ICF6_POPJA